MGMGSGLVVAEHPDNHAARQRQHAEVPRTAIEVIAYTPTWHSVRFSLVQACKRLMEVRGMPVWITREDGVGSAEAPVVLAQVWTDATGGQYVNYFWPKDIQGLKVTLSEPSKLVAPSGGGQ